jgi:hypothetical protein
MVVEFPYHGEIPEKRLSDVFLVHLMPDVSERDWVEKPGAAFLEGRL